MRAFSSNCSRSRTSRLISPGGEPAAVKIAPPWVRRTRPCASNHARSLRIVTSETAKCWLSSGTVTRRSFSNMPTICFRRSGVKRVGSLGDVSSGFVLLRPLLILYLHTLSLLCMLQQEHPSDHLSRGYRKYILHTRCKARKHETGPKPGTNVWQPRLRNRTMMACLTQHHSEYFTQFCFLIP